MQDFIQYMNIGYYIELTIQRVQPDLAKYTANTEQSSKRTITTIEYNY